MISYRHELKRLNHYFDYPEYLLDILVDLLEPERLILNPLEWLSEIHPWAWRLTRYKSRAKVPFFSLTSDRQFIVFYEGHTQRIYEAPLGDYRKFIENIYEEVYARLKPAEGKVS